MPKRTLRQQMLAQRQALSHEQWLFMSQLAQHRLLGLEDYERATCIALYAPVKNEVDTLMVAEMAFADGKRVLYPLVCGHKMVFKQIRGLDDLVPGHYGIPEPGTTGPDHFADEADIIVVPGVAFDRNGHRIGYGKGYYDRFLVTPELKAHTVGLCYEFQLVGDFIPADHHDIKMNTIITENSIIRC